MLIVLKETLQTGKLEEKLTLGASNFGDSTQTLYRKGFSLIFIFRSHG